MYDNIYTKYEDAVEMINPVTAESIVRMLEQDIKQTSATAEKCAYLSKAYVFAGDDKKSLKYAKLSVKLDKNYAYGYIRLAFTEGRLGHKAECLKNALKAEELAPDNWLIEAFLVHLYKYCGELERADNLGEKLENLVECCPAYFYNMGFINYSTEPVNYEKAIEYFKLAEEYGYADEYNLYYKMMETYGELGNLDKTIEYIDKCIAIQDSCDLRQRKAMCYIYAREYDTALSMLRSLYRESDDKQIILGFIAKVFNCKGEYNKALRYLRFAEYTTRPSLFLFYKLAETYENLRDFDMAIYYYKRSLRFNRRDEDIILSLSYCYSAIGENILAEKYADMAIALDSGSSYVYFRKGKILLDTDKYDEAIDCFLKGLEISPEDVDFYQWISYAYSKKDDHEKSLEFANRAILLNADDAYSYFRKAWALQELGRYDDAIKVYEKCIEHDSQYIDAYANISYCYSKMKQFKQSVLWANKALLVNSDYAYAHYRKAWALQELGKFNEAMDFYNTAISLDPADVYNYLGMASVSLNTSENLSALKFANKAILVDSGCAGAYYLKSVALSNLGKTKEAEIVFAKAKELGYEIPC